jgi:trimeric autotransporter adhesin
MLIGTEQSVGTVTFNFSRPVTNPRLHFARMGGSNGATNQLSYFQTVWDLTTAGATVTAVSGEMTTADSPAPGVDALRIQPLNPRAHFSCANPPPATHQRGGCGTVQINGTFSTLTFNVSFWYRDREPAAPANQNAGDAYGVAITLNEDFGDAPSTYGAAPHVVGDVQLGAFTAPAAGAHPSEADATTTLYTTAYPATSPVSNATATGDTDNALTLPLPQVGVGTYTLTVPVSARSGSAAGAQVCGWIDFNRNGTFTDGPPEEACAVAGASSATLSWAIPTGGIYVAGQSYLRLRIGTSADAAQVSSPTTAAATGEAEDYQITLLPRVRLTKLLSPTTDTGAFNLSVSPSVAAAIGAGTPSVTNVGHNGTTGFVPVPLNTAMTVQETAGTGTTLANYASILSCLNRAGASVATGTTSAGFTSMTSTPAAAPTVPATTANSDNSEISCTVTNTRRTADVTIAKTSTSNPVVSGGLVTYSIVVTNNGPAAAPGAIVTDDWTVAPGLDCSTAAGGSATCAATGTAGTQCPAAVTPAALQAGIAIPGFPNGGTVTFTLQCRVTATGQ